MVLWDIIVKFVDYKLKELPEQSDPWFPSLQVHNPVVWSHWPLSLHGGLPPGHDLSRNISCIDVYFS